jgi:hypothetical protein
METAFSLKHQQYIEKFTIWRSMVERYGPTTWRDYGCGPATSYQEGYCNKELSEQTDSEYILYDPCHEPHNTFPNIKEVPGVVCCDVIEHIPEPDDIMTLQYLFGVCREFMYLHISNKKGARGFVDGDGDGAHESTHCTLRTREEWVAIIDDLARNCGFPVVLTTDQPEHFDTFDHDGRGFTYDDWNMPAQLQQIIQERRAGFVDNSPEIAEVNGWPLTRTNFNV